MSWQNEREEWNRLGQCAREACRQGPLYAQHPTTGLKYCRSCTVMIDDAQGIRMTRIAPPEPAQAPESQPNLGYPHVPPNRAQRRTSGDFRPVKVRKS